MVEQPYAGEGHCYAILVASLDNIVVTNRAAGLCYVLDTALVGTLYVVAEREEGVAAEAYACVLGYPCLLLLHGEHLRLLLEELLPCALCQHVVVLLADVNVDCVVAVGTAYAVNERQVHHLRVLAQPPDVGLVACQG